MIALLAFFRFFGTGEGTDTPREGTLGTRVEQKRPLWQVRKFFPEAWLWAAVDVDSSGTAIVPVVAPDTITTWELSAFGVNAAAGV
eukprot:2750502-Pyramimonas_sp.AAC.1